MVTICDTFLSRMSQSWDLLCCAFCPSFLDVLSQTQRREVHFPGEIPVLGKELLVPGVRSLCGFSVPLGISNGRWAGEERRPTNLEVGVGVRVNKRERSS